MKIPVGIAVICAGAALLTAAASHTSGGNHRTPPKIEQNDSITLAEGVETVLYAGIEQDGQDTPDAPPDEGGGSSFNYCTAANNSTGFPALISHVGTLNLADNSFGIQAVGVPPHAPSWGMFTYGQTQYNVPFGNGFLCISPFFPGLFKMPTQSLGTGTVVNTMALHPAQFTAFTPGSGWNFQFWYRDPTAGGSNFNLSDGLHVNFAP
jgi:hypothetical protein